MKKVALALMLLSCTLLNAKKVCKSSCIKRIGSSSFSYNYSWNIADDALCTTVPWKGQPCQYSISINGQVFETGTIDGGLAVTC